MSGFQVIPFGILYLLDESFQSVYDSTDFKTLAKTPVSLFLAVSKMAAPFRRGAAAVAPIVVSCETNDLESSLTANSRRLLKVGNFSFPKCFSCWETEMSENIIYIYIYIYIDFL